MTGKHQIIVSAENNAYTGWQCKLFYFSCVTRLHRQPIIIVHDSGGEWHPDFHELARAGCTLQRAPNYRHHGKGDDYAPRNTAGTLIHAAELCAENEFIILCDPDMIFTGAMQFPEVLSGDFVSYLNYDKEFIPAAMNNGGITRDLTLVEKESLRCGVPYVIPTRQAREIGGAWLAAADAFSHRRWEDIMYAFGLAVMQLGLKVDLTHFATHNFWPDENLKAPIIHYCYGDERWTKRDYFKDEQVRDLWTARTDAAEGSILEELLKQIREAGEFYRDPLKDAKIRQVGV